MLCSVRLEIVIIAFNWFHIQEGEAGFRVEHMNCLLGILRDSFMYIHKSLLSSSLLLFTKGFFYVYT